MTRLTCLLVVLTSAVALAKPPRLVLVVSVDSLGSDVFAKNRARFKGGFARLLNEGAYVPAIRHQAAEACTAAGHATLMTGTNPWRHGVVSNRFYNRTTGKIESIFADPSHPVLDAPLGNDDVSPVNLMAETLGDRVRLTTNLKGKVIAVSGKARSAIAMAGHLGEAWWFHEKVGRFVTGTYYRKEQPGWVKTFNDRRLPDGYHGKQWELALPAKEYTSTDDRPLESNWYGLGIVFPHPLSGNLPSPGPDSYSALASSPFMNDVTFEFVKTAVEAEQLGKDEFTDLLSVSFSPLDRSYHLYGSGSWEVQDHLLRLDKTLGELIALAEKAAGGRQNLVIVLSADHGGAEIPEVLAAQGLDAMRVTPASIQKLVNDEVGSKLGISTLAIAMEESDIYLDWKAIADKKLEPAAVRRQVAAAVQRHPEVAVAVAREDIDGLNGAGLGAAIRFNYYAERSGDVIYVMKPFRVLESEPSGTSHGTPYSYDVEVPLFLWGRGVKSGIYPLSAMAADVAPTLTTLMEMGSPASTEGRALGELLNLAK